MERVCHEAEPEVLVARPGRSCRISPCNTDHLGSLAEAVLEALRSHPEAGARVEEVRTGTREEKKKMAMAMRAKQLKAIGLKTNDKGQVKAESSLLEQFQAIAEESGLACVICREGYR